MNAYDNVLKHGPSDIIPMVDCAKIKLLQLKCDTFLTTMKTINSVQFTPPFVFLPSTTLVA